MRALGLLIATAVLAAGCARTREYELRGQVLRVDPALRQLTIHHQDIPGFMPAMTMPFTVRDPRLLEGRVPGDYVRATLVVEDGNAYLRLVERTGHAPLVDGPPASPGVELLRSGEAAPDVAFIDQAGTNRRLSEWRGRTVAVTFIYTRCPLPNFCPLMDRHFSAVQTQVAADEGLRARVHLLSVSFDPVADRPAVLAAHARRLEADPALWTFATGERDEIDRFASRFGVSLMRESSPAAEIVHNLRTAVIDAEGRLVRIFNGTEWTPAELIAALRQASGLK